MWHLPTTFYGFDFHPEKCLWLNLFIENLRRPSQVLSVNNIGVYSENIKNNSLDKNFNTVIFESFH